MNIHSTAIISPEAKISPEAEIGPYCVINGSVTIGAGTIVEAHARIGSHYGAVVIGERNYIQNGAALGGPPQDFSYDNGFHGRIEVGDDNRIGEFSSVHLGTEKGGGITRIGNRNLLMAYVHIAHDCLLGDDIVITNASQLSGHVEVGDRVLLGGLSGVVQFVRLGTGSFLTGGSHANKDIPPYTIAEGHWASVRAVNKIGLKRAGFEQEERKNIEQAVRLLLHRPTTIKQAIEDIRSTCNQTSAIEQIMSFLRSSAKGVARR